MKKQIACISTAIIMGCTGFCMSGEPAWADYTDHIDAFTYEGIEIPAYDGDAYEIVNGNDARFDESQKVKEASEEYGSLDSLGRCTECHADLNQSLMPTWSRGSISSIYPTGWHNLQYDTSIIPGGWVYNRCHLIGFQLTGVDNVNEKKAFAKQDLITGTRFLNVGTGSGGMVNYENQVASYIKDDETHYVLYRVTPVFERDNLVADGVLMEGESVEDDAIEFCVFCYNVQPGIEIDYATGENQVAGSAIEEKISLSDCKVTIPQSKYVYTGSKIKPSVTVKYDGTKLVNGVDYAVSYGTNKSLGEGTVKVAGTGDYEGKKTLTFKIIPKATSITSLTAGKQQMTVKWRKQSVQTTGYQIQYSTSSSFTSKKTITIAKTGTTKRTIKKLKSKKTYYVRVRTYKKGGHYSKWSAFKKVKVQ